MRHEHDLHNLCCFQRLQISTIPKNWKHYCTERLYCKQSPYSRPSFDERVKGFSRLCSFCGSTDKTGLHLLCECNSIKWLWSQLCMLFQGILIFGITDEFTLDKNRLLKNHFVNCQVIYLLFISETYVPYKCPTEQYEL